MNDRRGRDARLLKVVYAIVVVCVVALLSACKHNEYAPPPPAEVMVAHPSEREVTTYNEFTGHTVAVEAIDIKARVQGILQSMHFTPGTDVEKGALLFVIEPALYEARAKQAEADLKSAQAQYRAADEQLKISQAIFERNAGSRTEMVQKTQVRDQALAAVTQSEARLEAAKLDLQYTHIYAPISGRIDRNLVDIGNLVGAGTATLLTSIIRYDPIYAYFDVSERDLLVYQEMHRRGETATAEGEITAAYLALATDEGFPHVGRVDYSANRLDPSTGTFELRAIFPNSKNVIVPGLFARIRVPFTREHALLLPEDAIGTEQGGRFVLVVNAQDTVEHRRIKVGALVDTERIIHDGVKAQEWIVINGLQRARAGAKVKPVVSTPQATPATPAPTP